MASILDENRPKPKLRILVIGKTGVGKSSLVNAILDKPGFFKDHYGPDVGTTASIEGKEVCINGVDVYGYDTRGFFDDEVDKDVIIADIDNTGCDFDVVVVCMRFNERLDKSNKDVLNLLSKLNRVSDIWKKVVIALTHGEEISPTWKEGIDEKVEEVRCRWVKQVREYLIKKLELDAKDTEQIPVNITTHVSVDPLPGHLLGWMEKLLVCMAEKAFISPDVILALTLTSARNVEYVLKAIAAKVGMAIPRTAHEAKRLFKAMCDLVGEGYEVLDKISQMVIDQGKASSCDLTNLEDTHASDTNTCIDTNTGSDTNTGASTSATIVKGAVAGGVVGGVIAGVVYCAAGIAIAPAAACVGGGIVVGIAVAALWLWRSK